MGLQEEFYKSVEEVIDLNTFENRLKNLQYYVDESTQTLKVHVPAEHIKQWLLDNNFEEKFRNILRRLTQDVYQVHFLLQSYQKNSNQTAQNSSNNPYSRTLQKLREEREKFISHTLNPDYYFENFVVGESNELAFYASKSVIEQPGGTNYNPLFIYGGVGLGKTHLLHGIGHALLKKNPYTQIVNLTTEEFLNEFMDAIEHKRVPWLIDRFRKNCDILLIDDIQFLSGKKKTQEHFFHIFNHLRDAQKQIVITSDRYPQEIPDIEDRLRSRFEWGLIVDILPPKFETRVLIIKEKLSLYRFRLREEVIEFLAEHLRSNIREIESILKCFKSMEEVKKIDITLDVARQYLQKTYKINDQSISVEHIQKVVSKFYDITIPDLLSAKRQKNITTPRQVAIFLAKRLTEETLEKIGSIFQRDHSTIINSLKKIEQLMDSDIKVRKDIKVLESMLSN
ncbi:chromosomal replication initiator protein DnaA [bacterium]|nr:chromosomal replication initiator protein DnaA [bacterium]